MAAKRDFGSFHSSNVQELLHIPEEEYVAPPLPYRCSFDEYKEKPFEFGKEARRKHFFLEDECTFLNHGAFGGVLKEALEAAQKYQVWTERQPLRFYDRELLPQLVHVTRRLAKFVGCDPTDLVLVPNATTALNTVIRSIPFQKGDVIFCLSVTYGAVKKMLRWACEQTGARLQEVEVQFPISGKEQIIKCVADNLQEGTKLAVFDHIPSNTPFICPLEEIIQICKQRQVPVLIDGAHALGFLPLDLRSLQPDYYVSNAHKWFCCPKGSAFMYVRKELQDSTRPLILSHGFGSGFSSEFIWSDIIQNIQHAYLLLTNGTFSHAILSYTGLHDYSPYLAMHTVIDFWNAVGDETIRQYMYSLGRKAGQLLTDAWGTSLAAPADMFGCMCLVELPTKLYEHLDQVDYSAAESIQNQLFHSYQIEVPIKCVQQKLYVRISAHIYNELAEYQLLADAILQLTKDCDKTL